MKIPLQVERHRMVKQGHGWMVFWVAGGLIWSGGLLEAADEAGTSTRQMRQQSGKSAPNAKAATRQPPAMSEPKEWWDDPYGTEGSSPLMESPNRKAGTAPSRRLRVPDATQEADIDAWLAGPDKRSDAGAPEPGARLRDPYDAGDVMPRKTLTMPTGVLSDPAGADMRGWNPSDEWYGQDTTPWKE
ncbi:MAG: hypothetical protein G8237_05810 [Magnetococcales bacterium]|nr:hypothetical protein [Magnetococcales bacterium]